MSVAHHPPTISKLQVAQRGKHLSVTESTDMIAHDSSMTHYSHITSHVSQHQQHYKVLRAGYARTFSDTTL